MFNVKIKNGKAVSAMSEHPKNYKDYENRNDWKTFVKAALRAHELTMASKGKKVYLATDEGSHVSPRFDIVEPPKVGDKVSYSFNGDTYPDGKVTRVSDSHRVVYTDTGSVYYRRKLSGSWVKKHGTWSLVSGHHFEQNPSF